MKLTYYQDDPEEWARIENAIVYTNGSDIVIEGEPPPEEAGELAHNCDEMGCGACHLVAHGIITKWDDDNFRLSQVEKALAE